MPRQVLVPASGGAAAGGGMSFELGSASAGQAGAGAGAGSDGADAGGPGGSGGAGGTGAGGGGAGGGGASSNLLRAAPPATAEAIARATEALREMRMAINPNVASDKAPKFQAAPGRAAGAGGGGGGGGQQAGGGGGGARKGGKAAGGAGGGGGAAGGGRQSRTGPGRLQGDLYSDFDEFGAEVGAVGAPGWGTDPIPPPLTHQSRTPARLCNGRHTSA
jgi:hypothetical protein